MAVGRSAALAAVYAGVLASGVSVIPSTVNFSVAEVQRASSSVSASDLSALAPMMRHTLGVLEKVRGVLGVPVALVSFVRSTERNAELEGSSSTSDHLTGYAVDIRPLGGMSKREAYDRLAPRVRDLGIDQLILNERTGALHIGAGPRQRHAAWIIEKPSPLSFITGEALSEAQRLAGMGVGALALLVAALLVLFNDGKLK
jgi:hypothetical protein